MRVGRVSVAGEHRQPHLAAHGGGSGALLVAARRERTWPICIGGWMW